MVVPIASWSEELPPCLENDLPALGDHAQMGLVVVLLRKAYPNNPKVQDQLLVHFQEYLNGLLDRDYLKWRERR